MGEALSAVSLGTSIGSLATPSSGSRLNLDFHEHGSLLLQASGELYRGMRFAAHDRNSIAKTYSSPGNSRHSFARHNNPHQIQRIGRRNCDRSSRRSRLTDRSQRFHGHRQSELFSQEAIHEAPAANFPAIL